jgi:hypothetical protein
MFSAVRLLPLVNSTGTTGHPRRYGTVPQSSGLWQCTVRTLRAALCGPELNSRGGPTE